MGCCPDLEALERAIKAVEEGRNPRTVAEGLLSFVLSFVSEQEFFGDDEKTREFINGLGLPKDGFFRACVKKVGDEKDITDPDKFCGKLKSAAVRLGMANPG